MAEIFGTPVFIDDGAYNDLYTAEVVGVAGAQRGVVFLISHSQPAADLFLTALTFGGVSAINILQAQQQRGAGFDNICLEAWVVKQANIPVGSQQIVATAAGGGNNDFKGVAYTIGDWDQVTPIVLSVSDGELTSGVCNLVVDPSPNDLVLVGWACSDAAFGYDTGENFAAFGITEDRTPSNSATAAHSVHVGYRAAMGHLDSAGAALNITLDSGSAEAGEAQIAGLLVFPAGSPAATFEANAADVATAAGTLYTPNLGIRITDIYQPNAATLVANATGVNWAVFDKAPDNTETRRVGGAAGVISNGDITIDSDLVGALAGSAFVTLQWTVGGNEITYAGTETVVDLNL